MLKCILIKRSDFVDVLDTDNRSTFKSPGLRLMEMMGYRVGNGLGRKLQGRLRPLETTGQETREGFGFKTKNYEMASDPDKCTNVEWLDNIHKEVPSEESISRWEKKRLMTDNIELAGAVFCDSKWIVVDIILLSTALKHKPRVGPDSYTADIKMGNIDIVYEHMFTCPTVAKRDEYLYFVDISPGPHWLCDYVLTKMEGKVRGYGFATTSFNTLRSSEDGARASPHIFSIYHGADNAGNIYDLRAQLAFRDTIMSETLSGVHIAMCAGENPAKGHNCEDEMTTRQLYICQLYLALKVMRAGANFVMRVGNLYSVFGAGLVYLIYRCFERISIFKPATSEPAGAERFVIGQGKLADTRVIENYLARVNDRILERKSDRDILGLVFFDDLVEDVRFREYLKKSNEKIGLQHVERMKELMTALEFSNNDDDSKVQVVELINNDYANQDDLNDDDEIVVLGEIISNNYKCFEQ
ncbi:cap-specific mRNA (nucleoside-2'-O-)-methyltransferase 1-like [Copidosoma floridanum]|uniref:cap-specific mRNA (nucleoside-2'-O-)-methyltransferase 1-like n=1 Tax=Copidosoma floridanum TaxID=29053 RepID=UPI0006C9DA60|nr:cap-specific mRNA (nucleoside-2'-O-)-methyltransferase 1-like [Copidosoma floridanum]